MDDETIRGTEDPVEAAIGLRECVKEAREKTAVNPFDFGDALARGILRRVRQHSPLVHEEHR